MPLLRGREAVADTRGIDGEFSERGKGMTNEEKSVIIAEKVMGWHRFELAKDLVPWVDDTDTTRTYAVKSEDYDDIFGIVWSPFTDLTQAMQVAERLRELGWHSDIHLVPDTIKGIPIQLAPRYGIHISCGQGTNESFIAAGDSQPKQSPMPPTRSQKRW